jgi:hypothetical protein
MASTQYESMKTKSNGDVQYDQNAEPCCQDDGAKSTQQMKILSIATNQ